jgi:hypothetical protein
LEKAVELLGKPAGELGSAERWALFFRYITDRESRGLMNEMAGYEEGIAMAGEALLRLSRDEAELARLESEYKYQLDYQSGIAEGERIGLEKERRKIEAKLRARGFSAGEIADILGISPGRPAGSAGLDPEEPGN